MRKRQAFSVRRIVPAIISVFLLFFIQLYAIPYTLHPTLAQESSPSAEIKSKLEQLKAEIASKAAKLKQEINKTLQNKAYVGSIKSLSENSITLASVTGPKIVNINQDTVYDSEVAKTKYSLKNAEEEDYISALGDIDDTGVLTARKIILMPKKTDKKVITWGQITTLGNNLMIKTKDSKNVKILLKDATTFQKGTNEIDIDKVKINDFVVVVSDQNAQEVLTANFVYIVPQGMTIKPKNIATPSAQEATKSATSSAKKQ